MRYIFILILIVMVSCSSSKDEVRHSGIYRTTIGGKKLYKKGFSHYKIISVQSIVDKDTAVYNEIRFYDVYGALYLPRAMEQKFGKPSYEVADDRLYMRVWNQAEVRPNETFTIAADGSESSKEMFTSASVFDTKGDDCLQEGHPEREFFIRYFSEAIWNYRE